jgi:RES domain-containing protein
MREVTQAQLPRRWRRFPAPASLQAFGDAWLEAGETAVLAVPSAVIPIEKNYLLNPAHPEMKSIKVGPPQRFRFDLRLQQR